MAEFLQSTWYSSGWKSWADWPTANNAFGLNSRDHTDVRRIIYKMDFGTLPSNKKRTTMTISETVKYNGPNTSEWQSSKDQFRFILVAPPSSGEPYNGSNPNGEIVAQADTSIMSVYKDGTFTFKVTNMDISGVKSGIYYLWIYSIGQESNKFAQYGTGDNKWPEISGGTNNANDLADVYTKPTITSFSVSVNSKTYYKPGEKFTVKWTGKAGDGPNNITKYQVGIQYGSNAWNYEDVGLVTSKQFEVSSGYRGQSIKTYVRAIGEQSGFTDGAPATLSIGTVNSLPSKPSITNKSSLNSAITGTQSITFQVSAGSDNDSQDYSVYYLKGASQPTTSNTTKLTSSSLTLTGQQIGGGVNEFRFFTYDGLEFSSAYDNFSLTVNLKPQFNGSPTFTPETGSGNNGTEALTKSLKITYALTAAQDSPVLTAYYRQAASSSAVSSASQEAIADITWNETSIIELNENQINKIITAGNYFKIGFMISNDSGDSEVKWSTDTYHRALDVQKPLIDSISYSDLQDENRHDKNYFKNNITIKIQNPSAGSGYADISNVQVVCGSKTQNAAITAGTTSTLSFDFSSSIENVADINVTLKDTLGRSITINGATQYRAYSPSLEGATPSINPTLIKPLEPILNGKVTLTHPKGAATGSTSLRYEYKITIDTKGSKAITEYTSKDNGNNTITIDITEGDIKKVINQIIPTDPNTSFTNSYFTVTAVDAFGGFQSKNSDKIVIDYRQAPEFDTSSKKLEIGHDYYINNINNWKNYTYTSLTSSSSIGARMFNPGEGVIIKIPKISDKNLSDKLVYKFYISRNELTGPTDIYDSPSNSNLKYESWFSLSQEEVKTLPVQGNFYIYRYTASPYSNNQYFYFRLDVTDSTNQTLSCYSNTYIIGCRIAKPQINIGLDPTVVNDETSSTLTLKHNITIIDLGGSANGDWDVPYYKQFRNLERSYVWNGVTYSRHLKITLEVTTNPSSWEGAMVRNYTTEGDLTEFSVDGTERFETEGNQKFYYRYKIYVRYGLDANNQFVYTESDWYTFSYSGKVPTMAHRPNWIGINTANYVPTTNEAFVVEEYNSRNIVVFRSADGTKTIKFYLKDGTVEGNFKGVLMDMVIDGGTW